jgi:hypothetical protein
MSALNRLTAVAIQPTAPPIKSDSRQYLPTISCKAKTGLSRLEIHERIAMKKMLRKKPWTACDELDSPGKTTQETLDSTL